MTVQHLKRCHLEFLEILGEQTRHRGAARGFVKIGYFLAERRFIHRRDRQIFLFFDFLHLFENLALAMIIFSKVRFFDYPHTGGRFECKEVRRLFSGYGLALNNLIDSPSAILEQLHFKCGASKHGVAFAPAFPDVLEDAFLALNEAPHTLFALIS